MPAVEVPRADDDRELDARARYHADDLPRERLDRRASMPNSSGPISASPESFSSTRRNGAPAARAAAGDLLRLAAVSPASEIRSNSTTSALVLERLRHRLRRVVDPRLLGEHLGREEALVDHPSTIFSRACSGFDWTSSELR